MEHPHTRCELDSHADTSAFGLDARVVTANKSVRVQGYSKRGKSEKALVGTLAIAYDCPSTLKTFILFFPEALFVPSMPTHLINPFQLREFGVEVNEVPMQHLPPSERTQRAHSISVPDKQLFIPLTLEGTMSGFTSRKPTWDEVNDTDELDVTHVYMTEDRDWDPYDSTYSVEEDALRASLEDEHPSLQLSPLQVRGQVSGDPMDIDSSDSDDESITGLPPLSTPRIIQDHYESDEDDSSVDTAVPIQPGRSVIGKGTDFSSSILLDPNRRKCRSKTVTFDGTDDVRYFDNLSVSPLSDQSRAISSIEVVHECFPPGSTDALDVDRFADQMALLQIDDHGRKIGAKYTVGKRKGFVTPEKLAKTWHIGLEIAKRTVHATTQLAVRDFTNNTGSRRLKPYSWVLKQKRISCDVFTDTMFGKVKSLEGNTCAQIYATKFGFVDVRPIKSKKEAHYTLDSFFQQVGIPVAIIPDNAKELTEGEFRKKCQRAQTRLRPVEAYTPNANLAEGTINLLKQFYERVMTAKDVPELLWDRCLVWCAKVRRVLALNIRSLEGKTPAGYLTGDTADISHLAEFGFYDFVWYMNPRGKGPGSEGDMRRKRLGRYLGPSENVGEALCGAILTAKGKIIDRTSIIPLSPIDSNSDVIKSMMNKYDASIQPRLQKRTSDFERGVIPADIDGDIEAEFSAPADEFDFVYPVNVPYDPYSLKELGYEEAMDYEEPTKLPDLKDADDFDLNSYISAKVKLPLNGQQFAHGVVKRRARDSTGELIGKSNTNPLFDTSLYEVEFEDGAVERYSANVIAEHIYSQVDKDGRTVSLFKDITDHRKDKDAVPISEGTVRSSNGNLRKKQTTKGWWLLVEFNNGTSEWMPLKDLKESNPIEVAEYVKRNGLEEEPAFAWWVPWTLRTRTRILKQVKKRYFRTTSKFGIELPKTVKRALEIDAETGTDFWKKAIEKEMSTVMKAFDIKEAGAPKPVGMNFIKCHLVFDIKAGTLQRKARFVADGSRVDPPDVNTYASVVSRESVRLAFLLAGLNGLDVFAADCEGAYLNAESRERLYTKCGPEFGEMEGRWAIITRALYGSKSAAASWRAAISKVIEDLGFQMCRADNDVWMRKAQKANGDFVWEYILVYSDDLLCVGINPKETLTMIDQHFKLKNGEIEKPTRYLGADIGEYQLPDGSTAWSLSSDSYVKAAIANVEDWMKKRGQKLKTRVSAPFPSNYKPELDVTDLLNEEDASYFQQQIGVLRWMIELGRVDIITEVSMLAAFSAAPRQGHMAAILHLYAWLQLHKRSKLVMDYSKVDHDPHPVHDWKDFYQAEEPIPSDAPEALGESVQSTCFVDSDHAGDSVTRRSRTGVLIFCNRSPIIFHSKKQGSVEGSSFGSEFSAMKTAVELLEGLRYKLRMMGVPLDGPTHIKADNMSVIHNCSNPASTLKKKSVSIAYHYVRERLAAGLGSVSYVNTAENLADAFTKTQPGHVRLGLMGHVLH